MFSLLPPCREYPFLETETERRMPGSSHRKLPRSSHPSSPTSRPSCQLSDYPVKSTFKNYSTTSLQSHNQSFLTPKSMILFLTCTLKWLSLKEGQCLLHSGNEEWEITFLFQVQTGSLRSHFPIRLHFKVNTFFFQTVLTRNYWNLSQWTYFLKASSWSSKSQAQIFTSKFGVCTV